MKLIMYSTQKAQNFRCGTVFSLSSQVNGAHMRSTTVIQQFFLKQIKLKIKIFC